MLRSYTCPAMKDHSFLGYCEADNCGIQWHCQLATNAALTHIVMPGILGTCPLPCVLLCQGGRPVPMQLHLEEQFGIPDQYAMPHVTHSELQSLVSDDDSMD
jgi:hypothetical protein